MVTPIKPPEVLEYRKKIVPAEVIKIVNHLIAEKWEHNTRSALVYQDDIINDITSTLGISRNEVFSSGYLNFEDVYKDAGWRVLYDSPGYNESYRAYFKFLAQ